MVDRGLMIDMPLVRANEQPPEIDGCPLTREHGNDLISNQTPAEGERVDPELAVLFLLRVEVGSEKALGASSLDQDKIEFSLRLDDHF